MNKQEAKQLIDNTLAQLRVTRSEHIRLQDALTVLTRVDYPENCAKQCEKTCQPEVNKDGNDQSV